jgi:hypothetical protein
MQEDQLCKPGITLQLRESHKDRAVVRFRQLPKEVRICRLVPSFGASDPDYVELVVTKPNVGYSLNNLFWLTPMQVSQLYASNLQMG